jgi:hypothetical protein
MRGGPSLVGPRGFHNERWFEQEKSQLFGNIKGLDNLSASAANRRNAADEERDV